MQGLLKQRRSLKQIKSTLLVVVPEGAKPLVMTLREKSNPHYILYVDYYGDVYAKFVGPINVSIAHSIWVPKTLVANKRGPIGKGVHKSKQ